MTITFKKLATVSACANMFISSANASQGNMPSWEEGLAYFASQPSVGLPSDLGTHSRGARTESTESFLRNLERLAARDQQLAAGQQAAQNTNSQQTQSGNSQASGNGSN